MENQSFSKNKKFGFWGYLIILGISLSVVLAVLANYGKIIDVTASIEYYIYPSEKEAEYKRMTTEMIALYGSGKLEYYEEEVLPDINSASANDGRTYANRSSNYIYIPDIKVDAPIIMGTATDEKTILSQLRSGVLLYPGSSSPGNMGTSIIVGHSSSSFPGNKYGYVFSKLPELSKGDLIVLNYGGNKFSYTVDRTIVGSVNELAALNIKSDLVLATCWPIGTAEKRIIITATKN